MFRYLSAAAAFVAALAVIPAQALEGHLVWHQGRQVTIVDESGWAIYDGEIIRGRTEDGLARWMGEAPGGELAAALGKSVTLGTAAARWPRGASGLFEMPYVIETD